MDIPQEDLQGKVVKYIIKNTPFGQANLVVKDLCKILNTLNPDDAVILAALKEHNEDHLAIFKGQNTQIISSILNAQDEIYVDQKKQLTLKVDHEKLTIISVDNLELPSNAKLDAFRDALETELNTYISESYNDKVSGFYVMYTGDETEYSIYFGISAKTINLPNFYCGDWISKWVIGNSELTGELNIQAHYYEEGNVQLKNVNNVKEQMIIDLENPQDSAKAIVAAIARIENRQQGGIEKVYNMMPDTFFKAMRRALPVTGTKMEWNVHVHKMVANLKQ